MHLAWHHCRKPGGMLDPVFFSFFSISHRLNERLLEMPMNGYLLLTVRLHPLDSIHEAAWSSVHTGLLAATATAGCSATTAAIGWLADALLGPLGVTRTGWLAKPGGTGWLELPRSTTTQLGGGAGPCSITITTLQ